jgi:SAM-dependent methyltransferase
MKIHPDDDMYTGSIEHYESVGKQLAGHVGTAASLLNLTKPRILELPCGYGRVTRHLVGMFPASEIVASDIMVPATDFVAQEFGVKAHPAQEPVHELTGLESNTFDIAVMGSLITHLSEANSKVLMKNFFRVLRPGGMAVVTITGVCARRAIDQQDPYGIGEPARLHLIEQYDAHRFGFVNYLPKNPFEGKTVEYIGDTYGVSLIPDLWMTEICQANNMTVANKIIGGWDGHQDVYLLQKQ